MLQFEIAGTGYQGRGNFVCRCHLRSSVWLRREQSNPKDPNAIAVFSDGDKLGYVPRVWATRLAPWMDNRREPVRGVITLLKAGFATDAVGAAVAIPVPPDIAGDCGGGRIHGLCCEPRLDGGTYVFLDCDETTAQRVADAMTPRFRVLRRGYSYRPASDGRHYDWYIAIADTVDENTVLEFLQSKLRWRGEISRGGQHVGTAETESQQLRRQLAEQTERLRQGEETIKALQAEVARIREAAGDWDAYLSEENESLRRAMQQLKEELAARCEELANERCAREQAEAKVAKCENASKRPTAKLATMLNALCPNIALLSRSVDVLFTELRDPQPALSLLRRTAAGDPNLQGKRVERAPAWRELHFSTGQDNSGRFYYSRNKTGPVAVLISFKSEQEHDIDYLANH